MIPDLGEVALCRRHFVRHSIILALVTRAVQFSDVSFVACMAFLLWMTDYSVCVGGLG